MPASWATKGANDTKTMGTTYLRQHNATILAGDVKTDILALSRHRERVTITINHGGADTLKVLGVNNFDPSYVPDENDFVDVEVDISGDLAQVMDADLSHLIVDAGAGNASEHDVKVTERGAR